MFLFGFSFCSVLCIVYTVKRNDELWFSIKTKVHSYANLNTTQIQKRMPRLRLDRVHIIDQYLRMGVRTNVQPNVFKSFRDSAQHKLLAIKRYEDTLRWRLEYYRNFSAVEEWNVLVEKVNAARYDLYNEIDSFYNENAKTPMKDVSSLIAKNKYVHRCFRHVIRLEDELYQLECKLKRELSHNVTKQE